MGVGGRCLDRSCLGPFGGVGDGRPGEREARGRARQKTSSTRPVSVAFLIDPDGSLPGLLDGLRVEARNSDEEEDQENGGGATPGWFAYPRTVSSIRDARPADAARLAEIHAVSWQAAYRGLLSDAFLDGLTATTRLDWWKSRLARVPPRWAVLVVEDDAAVVGFVTIGHCDDDDRSVADAGELYAMYVEPQSWNLGFGRDLLVSVEDRFRADAYRTASLWVLRDNRRGRRFYETGGWTTDRAEQRLIIGSDAVTAVRYVKELE